MNEGTEFMNERTEVMTTAQVIAGINWALLKDQKLALLALLNEHPVLEGLVNLLDELQDAAEAEGHPVVWITEGKTKPVEKERVTREEYEGLVEDGISNDMNAGGQEIDEQGRTRREYVESYLREQYEITEQETER